MLLKSDTEARTPACTLIIGLGNPVLGDDGVGWHVAGFVQEALSTVHKASAPVEVDFLAVGGLNLMERLIGYRRSILIDAMTTGRVPVGSIAVLHPEDLSCLSLESGGHLSSAHDASLLTALALGRSLGAALPDDLTIIAIEIAPIYDFGERLSPIVADAVPRAGQIALKLLIGMNSEEGCHDIS